MEEKVMKDCKVLALCSQKGGVGKTTSCVNLAVGLAKAGKKVLVIDNDPQGSMTASLGYHNPDELPITLATILTKIVEDELFENTLGILHHQEGIDLIPANIELSGMEVSLVNIMSRELVLKQYIERMREEYDYILIDCMFINMEEVAEDAYKNTELLLSQYTKVMFRIEKNLVDIDYEMYAEEGKHLKEMLYDLVDFDATAEKRRIQEKLLNNDMNLCLLEIMRDSLIALRDYPKNGQLYYRLLKYRYFEAGNTNEDVMLMLDDMPSTTYYRNRKKAIRLYATMLWAFTRPEKIQNKMEEINWKKSGSKVAVN